MRLYEIGTLGKPHGLKGEIRVILNRDDLEDVLVSAGHVFIQGLPYAVVSVRDAGHVLLRLEGVEDRDAALILRGARVEVPWAEELEIRQNSDPLTAWVGYAIRDEESGDTYGPIEEIIELPTQWTALVIMNGKEVLFPLHENLIRSVDPEARVIRMDLPDGLLDLYL